MPYGDHTAFQALIASWRDNGAEDRWGLVLRELIFWRGRMTEGSKQIRIQAVWLGVTKGREGDDQQRRVDRGHGNLSKEMTFPPWLKNGNALCRQEARIYQREVYQGPESCARRSGCLECKHWHGVRRGAGRKGSFQSPESRPRRAF